MDFYDDIQMEKYMESVESMYKYYKSNKNTLSPDTKKWLQEYLQESFDIIQRYHKFLERNGQKKFPKRLHTTEGTRSI